MPHSSVWCVSALRSRRSTGILVEEPVQRVGELVLVALRLGVDRDREHGLGRVEGRRRRGRRRARRARRRCLVSVSLATAAMSPAGTSVTGVLLLAAHDRELVQALARPSCARSTSVASGLIVPCSTLNRFTWPTYGSTMVLNTNATGWPSPRVGRGGLLGHEERREAVDADRAWSRCRTAPGTPIADCTPSPSAAPARRSTIFSSSR